MDSGRKRQLTTNNQKLTTELLAKFNFSSKTKRMKVRKTAGPSTTQVAKNATCFAQDDRFFDLLRFFNELLALFSFPRNQPVILSGAVCVLCKRRSRRTCGCFLIPATFQKICSLEEFCKFLVSYLLSDVSFCLRLPSVIWREEYRFICSGSGNPVGG